MGKIKALKPKQLRATCNPDKFKFKTTDDLQDLDEIIGQDRARSALSFGTGMKNSGYNLFVLGPAGSGKHTTVDLFLKEKAASRPVPPDWVYINNFKDPGNPAAMSLPQGKGSALRQDMKQLIEELRSAIPAAFESSDYKEQIQQIDEEFESKQEKVFNELNDEAKEKSIKFYKRPGGFTFAPTKDDEVIDTEDFKKLPEKEQEEINSNLKVFQDRLEDILQNRIPQWSKERHARIRELNYDISLFAVRHLINSLRETYSELDEVLTYLDEVQTDIVDNVGLFLSESESGQLLANSETGGSPLKRYEVNLLVNNAECDGAPVVYLDNPTYAALLGRIEHTSHMGTLITDFTHIRAGALHKANGGYLILDIHKVLTQFYSWEGLKRALYGKEIRIESLGQMLSLISTVSLEPEPIPLDIKVVLLGERLLYYLLSEYDPDFRELFKVAADFEEDVIRNDKNDQTYARLIATLVKKNKLRAFDKGAVAAVIEQSMRMMSDKERLSTHMRSIADLLSEASYWADENKHEVVCAADVKRAICYQIERIDRVRDKMHEAILRDTLKIDTSGEVVGQVNGLSVIQLGDSPFGIPSRITATTRLGEGEMVDIERETDLGGPIHSKGVFILSSYLGARYARDYPLSLNASLTFEQSYGQVEGDSASLGELCALLSSLAELPVKQYLAITGSVNQHGDAQAIGGVNEKIEGFHEICNARGLTGKQGVIIPQANVKHLMLREDIVDAVRDNKFSIYAVKKADEALSLLTGIPAGKMDRDGIFAEDTANGLVQARLQNLAALRLQYASVSRDTATVAVTNTDNQATEKKKSS